MSSGQIVTFYHGNKRKLWWRLICSATCCVMCCYFKIDRNLYISKHGYHVRTMFRFDCFIMFSQICVSKYGMFEIQWHFSRDRSSFCFYQFELVLNCTDKRCLESYIISMYWYLCTWYTPYSLVLHSYILGAGIGSNFRCHVKYPCWETRHLSLVWGNYSTWWYRSS